MPRKPVGLPAGTVVDGQVICGAKLKTRDGFCQMPPVKGRKRCRMHGGIIDPVFARQHQLKAKIGQELQARGWEPVTDPLYEIANLAGEIVEFKELCREQINNLETWVGYNEDDEEYARALVLTYERALDRAAKILVDMSRLGLDAAALNAAKSRPTREQADILANIMDRVFSALNLTAVQKDRLPSAIENAMIAEGLL